MKRILLILFVGLLIIGCKKETEPKCVTWIVTDSWENAEGKSLQDYNIQYKYHSGYDLSVCGAAKDTISEGKKVVLRTLHDTAFYVREYIVIRTTNK